MLGYITAEDVLGGAPPERRRPRPSPLPDTVSALYDLGMRHHDRKAVLSWPEGAGFESAPDWKLDRLVIRLALYARERLGYEPGGRLAVFGDLAWLWPVVDFAAMGFGGASLGVEHDAGDDLLAQALAEAGSSAVFATDPSAAGRLLSLRAAGRYTGTLVVPEGAGTGEGVLPLPKVIELGATLDTAERAQAFRLVCRNVRAEGLALVHAAPEGLTRLSHAEAMRRIAERLRARPAAAGDLAYLEAPRVTLGSRLALAAFVGDGLTTTTLGRPGRISEDVAALRPHKMVVGPEQLAKACEGRGPRWPGDLDRAWARRRLQRVLGDRLRWVEARGAGDALVRMLSTAGIVLEPEAGQ